MVTETHGGHHRTSMLCRLIRVLEEMRRGDDRSMTGVNRKSTWPHVSDAGHRGSTKRA